MNSEEINIENLTIDIFVDAQADADAFLNQSVDEIKRFVLPEIEKQLLELNLASNPQADFSKANSIATIENIDIDNLELELSASKQAWNQALSAAISQKVVEAVGLTPMSDDATANDLQESTQINDVEASKESVTLLDFFVDFLKTGILVSNAKAQNLLFYADLEAKIVELDLIDVWNRLKPILQQSKTAKTRLVRQASAHFWKSLTEQVLVSEVHQFVENWIKWSGAERKQKEHIRSIVLEFIVEKRSTSGTVHSSDFTMWKKEFTSFVLRNTSEESILELVKTISITKTRSELSIPAAFKKQWTAFSAELLVSVSNTSIKEITESSASELDVRLKEQEETIDSKEKKSSAELPKSEEAQKTFDAVETEIPLEDVLLENAGIVLLQPFYPSVFKNLGFLNEKNQWVDEEAQVKAIYTLHYIASGEVEVSEDQLLIEKLLTGFDLSEVIPVLESEDVLTEALEVQMNELLAVVHDNWKPMRNCTWVGLRNDFLTRSAELVHIDDMQYKLIVEPHLLDVLLPSKNWGNSMVKYSWMKGFVFVEWGE